MKKDSGIVAIAEPTKYDVTGSVALGNTFNGVNIENADNNIIGGTSAAARNVVSGNGSPNINLWFSASGNTVQGNYVGTDAAGTTALDTISVTATRNPIRAFEYPGMVSVQGREEIVARPGLAIVSNIDGWSWLWHIPMRGTTSVGLVLPQAALRYLPLLGNARMPSRALIVSALALAIIAALWAAGKSSEVMGRF